MNKIIGILSLLCLSLIFPVSAEARLGETREQLTQRYGKPIVDEPSMNFLEFVKGDGDNKIDISLHLNREDGTCGRIVFSTTTCQMLDQITNEILKNNAEGSTWSNQKSNRDDTGTIWFTWTRADGGEAIRYPFSDSKIEIKSAKYVELEKQSIIQDEQKKREKEIQAETEAKEKAKKALEGF